MHDNNLFRMTRPSKVQINTALWTSCPKHIEFVFLSQINITFEDRFVLRLEKLIMVFFCKIP